MSDSEMEERLEELGARIMELRGELAGLKPKRRNSRGSFPAASSKARKRKRG